jgi:hypothetical protein
MQIHVDVHVTFSVQFLIVTTDFPIYVLNIYFDKHEQCVRFSVGNEFDATMTHSCAAWLAGKSANSGVPNRRYGIEEAQSTRIRNELRTKEFETVFFIARLYC